MRTGPRDRVEAIIPLKTAIPIDAQAAATLAHEKVTRLQNVALAGSEIHSDRIELDDGGKDGGRICTNQLADRHLARRHDSVKGPGHVSVTEVDLGLLRIGLRRLQVGLRGVALVRLRLDGELRRAFFT